MVSAARHVRWWLDHDLRYPPDAQQIKRYFLSRWPDIRASEVLHICKLCGPHAAIPRDED